MNTKSLFPSHRPRASSLVHLAALALWVGGCTQNVDAVGDGTGGEGGAGAGTSSATNGGNNSGGDGGSSQGGQGTGGVPPGTDHTGIAMLQSELPPIGSGGGTSVATGPELDPNLLHVDISDIAISCTEPYGLDCGGHWKVSFALPVELQKPGVYSLEALDAYAMVTGADDPVDCSGGGGSWWDGQVEITEIDDSHVAGTFTATSTLDFDANGTFVALRCF